MIEVVDLAPHGELSDEDCKHFYRLLGSYRSLTEAVVGHAAPRRKRLTLGNGGKHDSESKKFEQIQCGISTQLN